MPSHDRLRVADAKSRFTNLRNYAELPDNGDYWYERPLDHRHLLEAAAGLHGTDRLASVEAAVIRSLAGKPFGVRFPARPAAYRAFTDFGLYIYRFDDFTLSLRCGPVGQEGVGGHAHNDQLSFDLAVGGRSVIVDPGTYSYTANPERRNECRSTAMHNTLVAPGQEQNRWENGQRGLFSLRRCCRADVISFGPDEWVAEHDGFGEPHRRSVRMFSNGMTVRDECELPGDKWAAFHLAPGVQVERIAGSHIALLIGGYRITLRSPTPGAVWTDEPYDFSPAYGWAEPAVRLRLRHRGPELEWQAEIEERS